MAVQEQVREACAAALPRMTHVPRDNDERPLVALCGYVSPTSGQVSRKAALGELPACVVCRDLWQRSVGC